MVMNMNFLRIGTLAKQVGLGVETIRFYEQKGLIPIPSRTVSGYREYPKATIARIQFIKRAKSLGFSLREVNEFLALKSSSGSDCHSVKNKIHIKIEDITQKITDLEALLSCLRQLDDACSGADPISGCPILYYMASGKKKAGDGHD